MNVSQAQTDALHSSNLVLAMAIYGYVKKNQVECQTIRLAPGFLNSSWHGNHIFDAGSSGPGANPYNLSEFNFRLIRSRASVDRRCAGGVPSSAAISPVIERRNLICLP
jgi:hypothetical protein